MHRKWSEVNEYEWIWMDEWERETYLYTTIIIIKHIYSIYTIPMPFTMLCHHHDEWRDHWESVNVPHTVTVSSIKWKHWNTTISINTLKNDDYDDNNTNIDDYNDDNNSRYSTTVAIKHEKKKWKKKRAMYAVASLMALVLSRTEATTTTTIIPNSHSLLSIKKQKQLSNLCMYMFYLFVCRIRSRFNVFHSMNVVHGFVHLIKKFKKLDIYPI